MSQRTTAAAVQALLASNYGANADGSLPGLQPYIDTASPIVDYVVVLAAQRQTAVSMPAAVQEIVERWLAAHFYTKMDPTYASKSAGGASGSFVRGAANEEPYLDGAMAADYSGTLRAVIKRQVASCSWLGTADPCAPLWTS